MPTPRETSHRGRATMARLIEFASAELDRVGLANFDIDSVLRKSKVSKGSLYHHFGSKNGLLIAVETAQWVQYLESQNQFLRKLVENCKSAAELFELMTRVIEISGQKDNREFRKKRLRAMVFAQHNKELASLIKTKQIEASDFLAETFQIAQSRGWIKPNLNLLATAYWFQGVFVGHVMLDITDIDSLDDEWNKVAVESLRSFFVNDAD
jgi:AcrR family transcriptional regulator